MFKELDMVVLKKPLPGASVPAGAQGTIVFVPSAGDQAYEVEFFDQDDKTVDVCTVIGEEYLDETGPLGDK